MNFQLFALVFENSETLEVEKFVSGVIMRSILILALVLCNNEFKIKHNFNITRIQKKIEHYSLKIREIKSV